MSLTVGPVSVLLMLEQRGLLSDVQAACDFGSLEFDSRGPENNRPFEVLFDRFGKPLPATFYDADSKRLYGVAGDFWRALGWGYGSFDIDGRWGSVPMDLNTDAVPAEHRQRYGLTMNIGTSEHVFNQYNFFLQAHDVTKVGGLMYHVVPFNNYQNHGMYQYCPNFFLSLAHYNKYEVLGFWQVGKPRLDFFRSALAKPEGSRTAIHCLLRRTSPDPFAFPLQVNEPMLLNPVAQERYGAFERQLLVSFGGGVGSLPQEFHLRVSEAAVIEGPPPEGSVPPGGKSKKELKKEKELRQA